MNPLQLLMQKAKMEQQGLQQQALTPETMQSNTLGALLSSLQAVEPMTTPAPSALYPTEAKAINPQITQGILQLLNSGNQQAQQIPSLAALLSGRV